MFPRTYGLLSSEERTLPKNTAALTSLCQRYPGKVNVLLAPAASDIYKENVPANAPLLDEDGYLDQLSAAVQAAGGSFVDVRPPYRPQERVYLLPHRPPLDEPWCLLRLQPAVPDPWPYPL